MQRSNIGPVKDLVGKPVLQVAEAWSNRDVLKLRHIYDHLCLGISCGRSERRSSLQKSVINRIREVSPRSALRTEFRSSKSPCKTSAPSFSRRWERSSIL